MGLLTALGCNTEKHYDVSGPDSKISVTFRLTDSKEPVYSIRRGESLIITDSKLGIRMEDGDFTQNLSLSSVSETEEVTDRYEMLHGKRRINEYHANRRTFTLRNAKGQQMEIIFQVSNDGVAFRYFFPGKTSEKKKIIKEASSFRFQPGTVAWMQPMSPAKSGWCETNPSYEEHYRNEIPVGTPSPTDAGWVLPALFRYDTTWIALTESALDENYCGGRLRNDSTGNSYTISFPQPAEVMPGGELGPESVLPWYTPWRVIAMGSLKSIMESTLETDLALPAVSMDQSFVKPGHASWSWIMMKDESILYDIQKRYIDFASSMHWEYCLIDVNWDIRIGYERIKKLADYAKSKQVGLILWYNSSGSWNSTVYSPKSRLLNHEDRVAEFTRIRDMGIRGVKVDFFGGDGQSVIRYYTDILRDAAAFGLMVNFHGCTYPRSWHRTWPNLVSMESIKGMEYITFAQENADLESRHCAIIPFTRNIFSPMDFTPVNLSAIPRIHRKTTGTFELALAVLFLSGIQHYAETPVGMASVPKAVREFMHDIPSLWDEVKFIEGYPGKFVAIARRSGDLWYVAGINGENTDKELTLSLPFIPNGKGNLITDDSGSRSFLVNNITFEKSRPLSVKMKGNGGFVLKIE